MPDPFEFDAPEPARRRPEPVRVTLDWWTLFGVIVAANLTAAFVGGFASALLRTVAR